MWVLGTKLGPLEKQEMLSTTEASLQLPIYSLMPTKQGYCHVDNTAKLFLQLAMEHGWSPMGLCMLTLGKPFPRWEVSEQRTPATTSQFSHSPY